MSLFWLNDWQWLADFKPLVYVCDGAPMEDVCPSQIGAFGDGTSTSENTTSPIYGLTYWLYSVQCLYNCVLISLQEDSDYSPFELNHVWDAVRAAEVNAVSWNTHTSQFYQDMLAIMFIFEWCHFCLL